MSRQAITVRVSDEVVSALNYQASQKGLSRQDLIEQILVAATTGIKPSDAYEASTYIPELLQRKIQSKIDLLKKGDETSLKRLVGKDQWATLSYITRRNFGKQFKELVQDGQYPGLKVGRKKTDNEQQYNRI